MNAWLVVDQREIAERDVAVEMEAWSQRGFHMQHYYHLYARAQIALYRGDGAGALDLLAASWRALERSLMLRIELALATILDCRARAAVAAGRLGDAERDGRRLERLGTPASVPCGLVVRAAVAAGQGRATEADALWVRAGEAFRAAGMVVHEAVAHRRLGELRGGGEGAALVGAADAFLTGRGVRRVERFAGLLAPVAPPAA